jgi:DNA-binding NarL/FixJ family response regulator
MAPGMREIHSSGMSATVIAPTFDRPRVRASRLRLIRGGAADGPAATREIRVLLAHRQRLVRAAFRLLLHAESGITVAGEASTGEEAVALARHIHPDVVLMDTGLPGLDAVEATRQISLLPRPRVMLLSHSEGDDSLFAILRAGASGILARDSEPAELVRAVRALARGDAVLSPAVTRRVIAGIVDEATA